MHALRIILAAFGVSTIAASSDFTVRCLVTYLRIDRIHEDLFSDVDSVDDFSECKNIISSTFDVFYNSFNSSQRFHDCMRTTVNGLRLRDAYIAIEALKHLDMGWKWWKNSRKNQRIQDLQRLLDDHLVGVQEICHETASKEEIAAYFDQSVKVKKEIPDVEDDCVMLHLLDQELADLSRYLHGIKVPKEDPGCEIIIKKIQDDFYYDKQKQTSDCIVKFYRKEKLAEQYMKVHYVLPFASLSKKQKSVERNTFIKDAFAIMQKAKQACEE